MCPSGHSIETAETSRTLRVRVNGQDFDLELFCPEGRRLLLMTNGADLFLAHAQFSCARCREAFGRIYRLKEGGACADSS